LKAGFEIKCGTVPVVRLPHFNAGQSPGFNTEYATTMGKSGFPGNEVMHAPKTVGGRISEIHTPLFPSPIKE